MAFIMIWMKEKMDEGRGEGIKKKEGGVKINSLEVIIGCHYYSYFLV